MPRFAAIDFETADPGRDSACALAVVRVHGTTIVRRTTWLIRPPRRQFHFTDIHGITWAHVADKPTFGQLGPRSRRNWPASTSWLRTTPRSTAGCSITAARRSGRRRRPSLFCTVHVARKLWKLRPANLPAVCRHLVIPLKHHDPTSDAEACARIIVAALEDGSELPGFLGPPRKARG